MRFIDYDKLHNAIYKKIIEYTPPILRDEHGRGYAEGFPDRNMQKNQRGGGDVPFLTFILGYGLGMIVTLWIVIRNS